MVGLSLGSTPDKAKLSRKGQTGWRRSGRGSCQRGVAVGSTGDGCRRSPETTRRSARPGWLNRARARGRGRDAASGEAEARGRADWAEGEARAAARRVFAARSVRGLFSCFKKAVSRSIYVRLSLDKMGSISPLWARCTCTRGVETNDDVAGAHCATFSAHRVSVGRRRAPHISSVASPESPIRKHGTAPNGKQEVQAI
jgi:hypothetical protein